jgi:L-iditol 2-dehydrogenase
LADFSSGLECTTIIPLRTTARPHRRGAAERHRGALEARSNRHQGGQRVLISQVIGPRRSEIVEEADPVPTAEQVLVDVIVNGVCTSDLSPWRSGGSPEKPIRLGHEIVGRVVATGANAGRWRAGDLVTGLGDRGFATRAVMDSATLVPVPAGLDPAHAIGEPIADLEEALARTPVRAGSRVAVVGLGFMGLGILQLAKTRAPGLLVGVDPSPAARERALRLGADLVLHPDEVADAFSPTGRGDENRMDVVLEATGVTPGLETSSRLVRPFGTLCVVGYHHAGTAKMDMDLWYKGATIVNGFCPDRSRLIIAMRDAVELLAARRVSYEPLVTHRFALEDVDAAYELMDARDDSFVKSVVLPNG